ncbi:4Fe-4S dicluster domain-containing protein [bacterium]|nr:4Fe-4S dicluster domain-containing protein [bacterium]
MLETLIYVATGLVVVLIPAVYILRERRKSAKAQATYDEAVESGQDQPVSLHPYIDPNTCIGTGACVKACPEYDVLGLINNRGKLINPSRCIGHGMCAAACPVDAIDLVIGTEKRGVDIPHVTGRFETNVRGIYISGELGGMGLIRNAVEQGRQAVGFIAESLKQEERESGGDKTEEVLDLLIIGAGPSGISGSLRAKQEGLRFATVDQDDLGGTVLNYPRRKLVMTQPMDLPLYGKVKVREIRKESLMEIFQDVFDRVDLKVHANRKVQDIRRTSGYFTITTDSGIFQARRVLLAIGRRGTPRKLGVEGEKSSKVAYRLIDPERFQGLRILVVGGGDSAVEAAASLSEQPGNTVHLSYRKEALFRIKQGNRDRFEGAVQQGRITPLFNSNVTRIEDDKVQLEQNGEAIELSNDHVFVMIGGELPIQFLQNAGIEFTRKFGEKLDA